MKYFDRQGRLIAREAYYQLTNNVEYKRIAWTISPVKDTISTVWMGIDLAMSLTEDRPLIFETMVFEGGDMGKEITCERTATEKEARLAHRQIVIESLVETVERLGLTELPEPVLQLWISNAHRQPSYADMEPEAILREWLSAYEGSHA